MLDNNSETMWFYMGLALASNKDKLKEKVDVSSDNVGDIDTSDTTDTTLNIKF